MIESFGTLVLRVAHVYKTVCFCVSLFFYLEDKILSRYHKFWRRRWDRWRYSKVLESLLKPRRAGHNMWKDWINSISPMILLRIRESRFCSQQLVLQHTILWQPDCSKKTFRGDVSILSGTDVKILQPKAVSDNAALSFL